MEEIRMDQDKNIIKIGQIAQILDSEYTILERMKIKKETIKRIGYALILYISFMFLFALLL